MVSRSGITYMSQARKQPNLPKCFNQNENKSMFLSKFRSWNKTKQTKTKHDTCETKIQQDFIIKKKQKQNETKLWQKNVPKTCVEHIKNNEDS